MKNGAAGAAFSPEINLEPAVHAARSASLGGRFFTAKARTWCGALARRSTTADPDPSIQAIKERKSRLMRPARLRIATSLILSLVRPAICAAGSGNDFTDRRQTVINNCPILCASIRSIAACGFPRSPTSANFEVRLMHPEGRSSINVELPVS